METSREQAYRQRGPRIAVVGPCASGKTTLVANLRREGVEAWAVGQEHSGVRQLWAKQSPDMLVALDVSLEVLRERRSLGWPATIYAAQHERLRDAFEHADLVLNTGDLTEEAVLAAVLAKADAFAGGTGPN